MKAALREDNLSSSISQIANLPAFVFSETMRYSHNCVFLYFTSIKSKNLHVILSIFEFLRRLLERISGLTSRWKVDGMAPG